MTATSTARSPVRRDVLRTRSATNRSRPQLPHLARRSRNAHAQCRSSWTRPRRRCSRDCHPHAAPRVRPGRRHNHRLASKPAAETNHTNYLPLRRVTGAKPRAGRIGAASRQAPERTSFAVVALPVTVMTRAGRSSAQGLPPATKNRLFERDSESHSDDLGWLAAHSTGAIAVNRSRNSGRFIAPD